MVCPLQTAAVATPWPVCWRLPPAREKQNGDLGIGPCARWLLLKACGCLAAGWLAAYVLALICSLMTCGTTAPTQTKPVSVSYCWLLRRSGLLLLALTRPLVALARTDYPFAAFFATDDRGCCLAAERRVGTAARLSPPAAGFVYVDRWIGLRKQDLAAAENLLDQYCPVPPEVAESQAQALAAAQKEWASDMPTPPSGGEAVAAAARSLMCVCAPAAGAGMCGAPAAAAAHQRRPAAFLSMILCL